MVKTKFKRMSLLALTGVITLGMMVAPGKVSKVSAATAADEAQITVGKTLTINGTKFPSIQNFEFELEAVEGYTNPNASTSTDGQMIAASVVPMPAGASNNKVTKAVGDFTTSGAGDSATTKQRKDVFGNIKYTTAGYYLYKLTEKIPATKVPGVVYDESSYYVVVYVVNEVDGDGNTINGVHVESVTAWHNAKGSEANKPNLKDIAAGGKTNGDNDSGDNSGNDPVNNDTWGNSGDQRYDGLGKVGASTPETKNELDATKFWNKQEMHDVILTKNVKGNLGDKTKQFEFTVTLTGLESGSEYVIKKTGAATLVSASVGAVDNASGKITADANGKCTFLVKVADDQGITLKNLPNNVTYQVSEAASNHAPSYAVTSSNNASASVYSPVTGADAKAAQSETYYTTNNGTDEEVADVSALDDADTVYTKSANSSAAVIASASGSTSGEKETTFATAVETVNPTDGDITIAYTNTRDLETITGLPMMGIYFGMAGFVLIAALITTKRKKEIPVREL